MTKLVVGVILTVLLGCSLTHTASATTAICGMYSSTSPTFWEDLTNVLASLAADTSPELTPVTRYYPYDNTGSAKGKAECHTKSSKECKKCLGLARDSLIYCANSSGATYDNEVCSMSFWQI
ncbi:hypothetical protein LINPERPRIM_LOCUS31990 [Linum perenne]